MEEGEAAHESRLRSVVKALTYRITGTVTTMVLTFAVTGEVSAAIAIGSVEPIVKLVVYYLHERAWQQVPIGTLRRLGAELLPRFRLQSPSFSAAPKPHDQRLSAISSVSHSRHGTQESHRDGADDAFALTRWNPD